MADDIKEETGIRALRRVLTMQGEADESATISQLVIEIVATLTEELGEKPSVSDLVDVIAQSLPIGDDRIEGWLFPEEVAAIGEENRPIARSGSRVNELNDAAFALAAQMLSMVVDVRARAGREASLEGLLSDLVRIIADIPSNLLARPHGLRRIRISGSPVRKTPKIGDLVSIPAAAGGYHLALVVAKNHFGTAFGIFKGTYQTARLHRNAEANPHPVYSDDRSILRGSWRVIGHHDSLRSLFPTSPEIYHRVGMAENAEGIMREVSDDEAIQVGLSNGTYRQAYMSEVLQRELDSGRFG
jgi:hypothetical protein